MSAKLYKRPHVICIEMATHQNRGIKQKHRVLLYCSGTTLLLVIRVPEQGNLYFLYHYYSWCSIRVMGLRFSIPLFLLLNSAGQWSDVEEIKYNYFLGKISEKFQYSNYEQQIWWIEELHSSLPLLVRTHIDSSKRCQDQQHFNN